MILFGMPEIDVSQTSDDGNAVPWKNIFVIPW
jgi:hypothetical protein